MSVCFVVVVGTGDALAGRVSARGAGRGRRCFVTAFFIAPAFDCAWLVAPLLRTGLRCPRGRLDTDRRFRVAFEVPEDAPRRCVGDDRTLGSGSLASGVLGGSDRPSRLVQAARAAWTGGRPGDWARLRRGEVAVVAPRGLRAGLWARAPFKCRTKSS